MKNRTAASLLLCFLIFLLLVIPSVFLVKVAVEEAYFLFAFGKQKLAQGIFENCQSSFCQTLQQLINEPQISYHLQTILKEGTNLVIQKGSSLLISLPRVFVNLFVLFFAMFYFLKDGQVLLSQLHQYLSIRQQKFTLILNRLKEIIHGVVYGYLVVAFIQGVIGGIGFYLFGVPSPLFWGLMMALLALIPFLGTGIVWLPASLILFFDGVLQDSQFLMFKGIGLFLYGLLLISSIDNILKPKLISEKAKIHPAVIMVGIFGGIFMFGALGVIVGPLILSLTTVFIDVYILQK